MALSRTLSKTEIKEREKKIRVALLHRDSEHRSEMTAVCTCDRVRHKIKIELELEAVTARGGQLEVNVSTSTPRHIHRRPLGRRTRV